MGENAFLGFLVLLVIALCISSLVFYRYVFLLESAQLEFRPSQNTFQTKPFEDIVRVWQERGQAFEQASPENYRDAFAPAPLPPEAEESDN